MLKYEKSLYRLLSGCLAVTTLLAFHADGWSETWHGFLLLQTASARLISDFTATGGTGGALLNAAITGGLALLLIRFTKVALSGPTVAAVFTIMGFSLFGKTVFNTVPIVLGVFLAARFIGKPFNNYLLFALFGTALGPLVTFLILEAGLPGATGLLCATAGGILTGFAIPALAMAMLRMHEGFNLYNIGLACGFFGLFAAAFFNAAGHELAGVMIWNETPGPEPALLLLFIALLFLFFGWRMDGRQLTGNLKRILRLPGRLPTDFMSSVSCGAALVNAGLLGLAGLLYLHLIGAEINGPVAGGLFTIMGFATFGKHPRNCWPIALGVLAATLLFGKSPTAPGPLLALLFGTTLAPLAGEFGPGTGFAAGCVHLMLVERSAAWHGGLDLYNNGFAGGLTATFFVAIIQWKRGGRPAPKKPEPVK